MAEKLRIAVLFLLFALTFAATPSHLPENDVAFHDVISEELPESDTKISTTTILLPSEKPDSEPATVVEFEPENEQKIPEIEFLKDETGGEELAKPINEEEEKTVPLTVVNFRPINRRFPLRPFRRGHRCHHGRGRFKPWAPRFDGKENFYGKDMILGGGRGPEEEEIGRAMVGEVRRIPARWEKFHPGMGPRFIERRSFRHHGPHHHHRDVEDEVEEREERGEHEHKHKHEHEHEHGFVWKIRKFLNHHF